MNVKKIISSFCLATMFLFSACSKKSELADLDLQKNVFTPENNTPNHFFVVDSFHTTMAPYLQFYYHIRYDLIPDASKISKIVIYKNGLPKFSFTLTQNFAFSPYDNNLSHMTTYGYTFAFQESDGTLSTFSDPYYIYVP